MPAVACAALAGGVFAGAAFLARRASLRHVAALLDGRPGLGADGIVVGGGALELPAEGATAGGDRAALVLHGFGDTPQSVAFLAGYLASRGWHVRVPLLPGHGRTLRSMGRATAAGWVDHASAELARLRGSFGTVVLVGQSMGGALATILAARDPSPPAIVLLAPYLGMPAGVRWLARSHLAWSPVVPFLSSASERSILDAEERARSLAYGAVSGAALRQLLEVVERARRAAPDVTAPLLLVQSRRDNRIPARVTRRAFASFGSARKELVWAAEGGHVLAADRGRERLSELVATWLDRELSCSPAPARAVPERL